MLKKIDNYFFDEEHTTFDRICYYGTLAFGIITVVVCWGVVSW